MLTENNDIDKLFLKTLGEYQKTPPASVWTNIEEQLDLNLRSRRIVMQRRIAIAAAILVAVLAGWWMLNPAEKGLNPKNSIADQTIIKNIESPKNSITADTVRSNDSTLQHKVNRSETSKVSQFAAFAANTTFIDKKGGTTIQNSGERVLLDSEKELLDKLEQKFKVVKKITDWIADKVSNDTIQRPPVESKSTVIASTEMAKTDKTITFANNYPVKNKTGRWSIKAEFAPVFNSNSIYNVPVSNHVSSGTSNYSSQKTTSENTFSGGIMAGYKVGKRLVIKSGMTFSNISQSTRNVNFTGGDPLSNLQGSTIVAVTPAGEVRLNNIGFVRTGVDYSSNASNFNSVLFSGENQLKQNIQFVEIPVQATYKLIDSKVDIGITGGICSGFLVGNKAALSGNGDWAGTGETSNMRNIVYSTEVGLELGYEITNRITLSVEPRLRHYINSLSTSKSANYKPNQMEIVTGLTYSFN